MLSYSPDSGTDGPTDLLTLRARLSKHASGPSACERTGVASAAGQRCNRFLGPPWYKDMSLGAPIALPSRAPVYIGSMSYSPSSSSNSPSSSAVASWYCWYRAAGTEKIETERALHQPINPLKFGFNPQGKSGGSDYPVVLAHEVVQVRLRLRELHLVHALTEEWEQ